MDTLARTPTYPLSLSGTLDEPQSRWLWLVKWFLLIPHWFALAFLFLASFVGSVGAFFAILVTGRYPRGLFDFNVGVQRWAWRVSFYSYSALGTDQYPPFTLREQSGDHARLDVEYPQSLSRSLVLVKWLLALPHFLILAVAGSVRGMLVFFAGLVLLFTGRYPQELFDLVMGINRWTYRVIAYAGLMTDVYPPFRFDEGGEAR
jgi:hypothetical protein